MKYAFQIQSPDLGTEKESSSLRSQASGVYANRFCNSIWSLCTQEKEQSALRAHSSSIKGSNRQSKISEQSVAKTEKSQPFIKEEVLSEIYNVVLHFRFSFFLSNLSVWFYRMCVYSVFSLLSSLHQNAVCVPLHRRAIFQAFVR